MKHPGVGLLTAGAARNSKTPKKSCRIVQLRAPPARTQGSEQGPPAQPPGANVTSRSLLQVLEVSRKPLFGRPQVPNLKAKVDRAAKNNPKVSGCM